MSAYSFTPDESDLLSRKPRLGTLTVGEKIAEADLLKQQGNLYFKAGLFKKANQHYVKIFLYVNGLSVAGDGMSSYAKGAANASASESEGVAITQLKLAAHSNMAMCHLKLDNPDKAIEQADKVLAIAPGHVKALLRKAQAYRQKGKYTLAKDLLREALVVEPKNAALRSELKQVLEDAQLHPEVDEMKAKMTNMFNKAGGIYK
ncbi:hypothetical protein DYB37_009885 [Aphanomyces astaci]|uniref:Uncharacterized protein n=3 Tax=Aphanomyces astaci TaxID=112090 RepID=A0A3R7B9A0_APHAT|nr:hypothetical protein DYB34_008545 [Aphanomyces astaci]RHY85275.1 hypothetical protein DYB35_009465 [Aphanomyces astaci]RHZ13363.1 hypothetical protein DYB37_009885 [Aphanomyces astaci]